MIGLPKLTSEVNFGSRGMSEPESQGSVDYDLDDHISISIYECEIYTQFRLESSYFEYALPADCKELLRSFNLPDTINAFIEEIKLD